MSVCLSHEFCFPFNFGTPKRIGASDGSLERSPQDKNTDFFFFENIDSCSKKTWNKNVRKNFLSNFGTRVGAMDSPGGPLLRTEEILKIGLETR